jgi:hypothetical protein
MSVDILAQFETKKRNFATMAALTSNGLGGSGHSELVLDQVILGLIMNRRF